MKEYLVIPGQYSGDMWHIAGAMLVRSTVHAVVSVMNSSDAEGAVVILEFFTSIGLQDRVTVVKGRKASTVYMNEQTFDCSECLGKPLAWQHLASVQATFSEPKRDRVHPVYKSTSIIMHAMEKHSKLEVLMALRSGLTHGLPDFVAERIVALVLQILKGTESKRVLFVLGRVAGYNPQHDLTPERMAEIGAAAKGWAIVPVGYPPAVAKVVLASKVKTHDCVDLRDWELLTGSKTVDERARAYFWKCVVDLSEVLGISAKLVGGRSGSTDLPAFMGLPVLCWDICDPFNPEYLRLLITAPELLRVTHTGMEEAHGGVFLAPNPLPQFGTDLALFLGGAAVRSKLIFAVSKSTAKKKSGNVEQLMMSVLGILETACNAIFISADVSLLSNSLSAPMCTAPKAYRNLTNVLRPYYSTPSLDIDDVGAFLIYVPEAQSSSGSGMLEVRIGSRAPLTVLQSL